MARSDSRERILDAAERLFAEKGVAATSLREIGMHAQANPGSIYFHWKTKADLVRDVFRRRLEPLDAERIRLLAAAERASAPDPAPLAQVLTALVGPMLWIASGADRGGPGFLRLLGRTYNEPDRDLVRMLRRDHGHRDVDECSEHDRVRAQPGEGSLGLDRRARRHREPV